MSRVIRSLTLAEIGTLLDWAAREGWNPGLADAQAFRAVDPDGFIGAFVDGIMVAAISAAAYDAHFGFIGLYICHPAFRGQGHGKAVWDAGMAHLGDRTIGLDGVPGQQANYARMSFVAVYDTLRLSGTLPAAARRASPVTPEIATTFDRRCFPAPREAFMREWLASPNTSSGDSNGFAVFRPCRAGSKIGPLLATNIEAALGLITAFEGPVQIDVPAGRTAFIDSLRTRGFTSGFTTARMYRGPAPMIDLESIFAVSCLELG